jgi:hypothetical protein
LSVPTVAGQSCCSSAAISRSLLSCSRAWCPQNSSSPPDASTARKRAAAPQRSQRSAAVNSGRASVVVMWSSPSVPAPVSRCHFRPRSLGTKSSCSLLPLLQTLPGAQVFPRRCDCRHVMVYPDAAAICLVVVPLCSRHQGICHVGCHVTRDVNHFSSILLSGSPSENMAPGGGYRAV